MEQTPSNKTDRKSFGARLTELIEQAGISQTELARKAGIERSAFNRLVNDKREPKPEEVEWIAAALNIQVSQLVEGVTFAGEPPERQQREAELAARILAAESELQEAKGRAEALERGRESALRELEEVRAEAVANVLRLRESFEREKAALQEEAAQRELNLRTKCKEQIERVQQAALRQEDALRRENARLRQENFTKDLEIADLQARGTTLANQTRALQAAVSEAKGTALLSGLLGTVVGGLFGAAMASDNDEDEDEDEDD